MVLQLGQVDRPLSLAALHHVSILEEDDGGEAVHPYFSTSSGLGSTSILTILSVSAEYSPSAFSTTLLMSLQGPHQVAQKSTSTGTSDCGRGSGERGTGGGQSRFASDDTIGTARGRRVTDCVEHARGWATSGSTGGEGDAP